MTAFNDFWQQFDGRARIGMIVGATIIVLATVALGFWTLRTEYQVLFADLAPQDAATMVTELEKLKTPYRLSGGGNTILVPADVVYKTRLSLVGKELPLQGAVGFELFNNSEVGMTEFAQKVNYQRALQGELTRTILSLHEIQSARVHLVLSEQGLFKKNGSLAKASITLALKPGKSLDANQVQGIQRLVGAAVPDIKPQDVTIIDHSGNALTRRIAIEGDDARNLSGGLDDKRALEAYLNKKVVDVLDRTFGAGQGIASVDVTLNHEHVKTTTENVLGANENENSPTGVKVRERQTSRGAVNGDANATPGSAQNGNGLVSREVDYQVGRRVEQVVSAPGAISHISIAVVIRKTLDQTQLDRLKNVVASAAGISTERGDGIAVYSVDQFAGAQNVGAGINDANLITVEPRHQALDSATSSVATSPDATLKNSESTFLDISLKKLASPTVLVLAALLLLAILLLAWRISTRHKQPRQLSHNEREALLAQMQQWLDATPKSLAERNG